MGNLAGSLPVSRMHDAYRRSVVRSLALMSVGAAAM